MKCVILGWILSYKMLLEALLANAYFLRRTSSPGHHPGCGTLCLPPLLLPPPDPCLQKWIAPDTQK